MNYYNLYSAHKQLIKGKWSLCLLQTNGRELCSKRSSSRAVWLRPSWDNESAIASPSSEPAATAEWRQCQEQAGAQSTHPCSQHQHLASFLAKIPLSIVRPQWVAIKFVAPVAKQLH